MNKSITSLIVTTGLIASTAIFTPSALALTNYSASMNFAGSGEPSSLVVGQSYTLTANIHVNQQTPRPINSNGVWDVFGLSMYRINQSGGKTLNDPNDSSVTVEWLGANRGKGNDSQQAYMSNGNVFPSGHTRWDDFQCGEQWLSQNQTASGKNITINCTFTPKTTGFYQIDINSFYYYSTYIQNCYTGWCGPIGGYFIKVVNPQPTPPPQPTQTPSITPQPTKNPTPTPKPTVTPKPTCTPTPKLTETPTPSAVPTTVPATPVPTQPQSIIINNTTNNNNVNSIDITNNNTATAAATQNTTVQPISKTVSLPSTGTPIAVYSIVSLLPLGWKLKKFAKQA